MNILQVFDPLANAIKGLKEQEGFMSVTSLALLERKWLGDVGHVRETSRGKPKEVELEHPDPNVGAGYILPLLQHVIGELKSILDGKVHLETCRPLAFYVFHGLMER
jgi:hypothetical protein